MGLWGWVPGIIVRHYLVLYCTLYYQESSPCPAHSYQHKSAHSNSSPPSPSLAVPPAVAQPSTHAFMISHCGSIVSESDYGFRILFSLIFMIFRNSSKGCQGIDCCTLRVRLGWSGAYIFVIRQFYLLQIGHLYTLRLINSILIEQLFKIFNFPKPPQYIQLKYPMTQTEKKPETVTDPKAEEENSSSDEHEHEHDENCGHDHGHDHDDKKGNRGEKKFKKAMGKMGLKQVTGINRVTIKKGKAFVISIDDPDVWKSPGAESAYVIFGKPNLDGMGAGQNEVNQFTSPVNPEGLTAKTEGKPEGGKSDAPKVEETSAEDLSEEGLSPENIKMVMEYGKCSKAEAIRLLRETNNDSVNAIMKLDKLNG